MIRTVEAFLNEIAKRMDISETMADAAKRAYESVGSYLQNDMDGRYAVDIHPQGSFNLGTVVKPSCDKDEYDIDLVCLLNNKDGHKPNISAETLKREVGESLQRSERYRDKLDDEGKRCWTLQYEKFHMDILPSRPDSDVYIDPEATRINLTNRNDDGVYTYRQSNPAGYRHWFRKRMTYLLKESAIRSFALRGHVEGKIEEVPEYRFRTPLQRSIQLLKRHRDEFYADLPETRRKNKPISMIITTLAAKVYAGEPSITKALASILSKMADAIDRDENGVAAVWNPALGEREENFAEKWIVCPEKESEFNAWLCKARTDFNAILSGGITSENLSRIRRNLGESLARQICRDEGIIATDINLYPLTLYNTSSTFNLFYEKHRQRLPYKFNIKGRVNIIAWCKSPASAYDMPMKSNSKPLPKNCKLLFRAKTNVQRSFTVEWQIVNNGTEAKNHNQLRGDFRAGDSGYDEYGAYDREITAYAGTHYVVCYIIQNGECVAKSPEFVVNVV